MENPGTGTKPGGPRLKSSQEFWDGLCRQLLTDSVLTFYVPYLKDMVKLKTCGRCLSYEM